MTKTKHLKIALLATVATLATLLSAGAASAAVPFGVESVSGWLRAPDGTPLHAAGAHADLNTTIDFTKEVVDAETGATKPTGDPRNIDVSLPPGLVGNPLATPKCTQAGMTELKWFANCEPEAQVGLANVEIYDGFGGQSYLVPVYNLVPPTGTAGEFAFNFISVVVFVDATVTADGEYHLVAKVSNASQGLVVVGTSVTFWGVPASPAHDRQRVRKGGFTVEESEPIASNAQPPLPFMSNPTSCSGTPLATEVTASSWQESWRLDSARFDTEESGEPMTIGACDQVPFEASLKVQPTNRQAEAPTGLDVDLTVPQNQLPEGLTAAHLRDAVVQLPAGMTINPAAAGGLGSCSPAQIGLGEDTAPTCPENSKIGSVTVKTPLLAEPLTGSVYLAQQGQNKFGSLLALYVVVDDPTTGVRIKIPGKVESSPTDGRLVTRFEEAPQLPFETLTMHLDGGPRAPLINPPSCGTYTTTASLAPWSGTAPVGVEDSFTLASGPEGGACPDGRFAPTLHAASADPAAGRYSPFEFEVARADGTEGLGAITTRLPRGLLARLAGTSYCPDSALAGISGAEGAGAAQLATPACPASSRIGTVAVAAGAGPSPLWVPTGAAYLAGPYKGAPLSLAVVAPAVAGPFDLGNVVVRTALQVDPTTAQVTAVSDRLPTILHGIPLDLRTVRVTLDRPSFTVNPTSCAAQEVLGTITSIGGKPASPAEPFAATGCTGLPFGPSLSLSLTGGLKRTGNPALTATLKAAPGQANIAKAQVILPKTMFIDNAHINNPCTRVQFGEGKCPPKSILGTAVAYSPLLDQPLTGPVYFRSNGGERQLPDLVADLQGQIHITLVGFIDSVKAGKQSSRIRTRFNSVPDAPVSKFVLKLKGGKKGLIENAADLCRIVPKANVRLEGQNGKTTAVERRIGTTCDSAKKSKNAKR